MFQRLLLLWLVLLSSLAYFWPAVTGSAPDPWLATKPGFEVLFAVAMFAIGSLLPRDEVAQVVHRWPMVAGGTLLQYTSMPLLAWGIGHAFGLQGPLLAGVLLAGCVPGAMASNVLTMLARGNVSYSVSLTTLATLVSPLMVPLGLWLTLGHTVDDFPAMQLILSLCRTVVLPVLAGHGLSRVFPWWRLAAERFGATVANLAILWIIASVVAFNRDRLH
ncbi:MAG: bile acid:sodium symporter family protein, partial [Planctomycetota bacterium]